MSDGIYYDVMQVCLNGHLITSTANEYPSLRQKFCEDCGSATTMECDSCHETIRGDMHSDQGMSIVNCIPKYCIDCGNPYPWQKSAIENLEAIIREGDLNAADMDVVVLALPDVVRDTPKTELASVRLMKVMSRLGKPIYDVAINVISDIASETAKKAMGLK